MKPIYYFSLALLASASLLDAQSPDPVTEAATLSNQGRHAEASAVLQQATDLNPGDEGLRFRLATARV